MDGGAQSAVVKRIRSAWGKFRELEPLFLVRDMSLRLKGSIYTQCVRTAMLLGVRHGV